MHAGANLAIRIHLDHTEHALWLSNVCHALCAAGLLLGSRAILSVALCGLLVPHSIWLFDAAIGLTTGDFPIGVTAHTVNYGAVLWFVTSYHFYLLPVLLLTTAGRFDPRAALRTPALYAVLLLLSLAMPVASNVNYAHNLAPRVAWTAPINAWPEWLYVVANLLATTLVGFAPAWWLLTRFSAAQSGRSRTDRSAL